MPVVLTTASSDATKPKEDYEAKTHKKPKLTADGSEGNFKYEETDESNSGDATDTNILIPICAVLVKIQADLKKIEEALNKIETGFATHIHPTGVGPSGPPTSPITL